MFGDVPGEYVKSLLTIVINICGNRYWEGARDHSGRDACVVL